MAELELRTRMNFEYGVPRAGCAARGEMDDQASKLP